MADLLQKRVVVTGGTGFVGRGLVPALAASGWTGWVSTRGPTEAAGALPAGWAALNRADLLAGRVSIEPAVVIHLEVKQHVLQPTAQDHAQFTGVNVRGTSDWLAWAADRRVGRFLFLSTIKAVEPLHPGSVTEASPVRPGSTPYGRSKWEAEALVRAWAEGASGRRAGILRPAVVYGPGNAGNIAAMVEGIAGGRFCLIGENANRKALVSLKNLTAAMIHLLDRLEPGCATYFVTDAETRSVREIAETVARFLGGRRVPTLPVPLARMLAGVGEVAGRVTGRPFPINRSRLQALLEETDFRCEALLKTGFQHPQTLEEGLREMVKTRP